MMADGGVERKEWDPRMSPATSGCGERGAICGIPQLLTFEAQTTCEWF
jgi:hypothetical protein